MTAHSIETRSQRASLPRAPLLALAALIAVAAAFAVAFLLAHHSAPRPAAAKVVHATIKPGPSAATLKKAFATPNLHALIKPVVHKKKPKATPTPATSSSATPSDGSSSSDTYTPPATTYTPPATSSSGSSGTSSAPKKKSPPSGDGIITIG